MLHQIPGLILLGAYAGLRVSEIAAIRGEHVDVITSTIAITGKGEKTRYIPLHPAASDPAAARNGDAPAGLVVPVLGRQLPARGWRPCVG